MRRLKERVEEKRRDAMWEMWNHHVKNVGRRCACKGDVGRLICEGDFHRRWKEGERERAVRLHSKPCPIEVFIVAYLADSFDCCVVKWLCLVWFLNRRKCEEKPIELPAPTLRAESCVSGLASTKTERDAQDRKS